MDINRRFFETHMQEKNLSLRRLANMLELGHSQLSLTFSGQRRLQINEAVALANIFGVPLYRVIEAAGVSVRKPGKRVPVIGAVKGDATVEMYPKGLIERTTAPEEMPDDTVAVQCRSAGGSLEWLDRSVLFARKPEGIDPTVLGCLCLAKIKDGPVVLSLVQRGYTERGNSLRGPFVQDNAILEWATPIQMVRN
jgi:transcriptional regulator with XRE-family HTH domain